LWWTGEDARLSTRLRLFFWFFGVVYYIYYAASDVED
jgi:hypothetical protein